MKKDTETSGSDSLRPESAASAQSGRSSKQSLMRSNDLAKFQRQTLLTPTGFKTMRIYTTSAAERNALQKYKPRPKSALEVMTPKSTNNKGLSPDNGRLLKRASSANELHRTASKGSQDARPSTASSVSSATSSSRSIIFNSRHPSCLPPDLYRQDKVRAAARRNHPRSATHSCVECNLAERHNTTRRRRARSAEVADRYGTPIALPSYVKGNKFLTHEDLDMGQKQYIWGMARVYSTDQLKSLKQRQYQSVLNYEYMKRVVTRGVQENDRIKLWKEYLEYQKVIDRIGKDGSVPEDKSLCSKYLKSHVHAKKHRIVGWTTELSEGESSVELDGSFGEDSSNKSSQSLEDMGLNNERSMEGRLSPNKLIRNRPRSSKYKTRRTEITELDDMKLTKNIMDANDNIDESLSLETQEKLSIGDTEDNFI